MARNTLGEERRENLLPHEVTENKEDILLIWLKEHLYDSIDSLRTHSLLLELNPAAHFYTDVDRCVNLIKSIKHERIVLIISGVFAQSTLPKISSHRAVVAIFIFCADGQHQPYETPKSSWGKIVGTFIDQDRLFESVRETLNLIEKQTLTFGLFDQKQRLGRDLSQESAPFIWHQMLLFMLKQMPQNQQSKEEMLNTCRNYYRNNKRELDKIEEFRLSYASNKAIEWYTDNCFLYRLLNKALRTEDIELLYTFRFFIIDLCTALEKENFKSKSKAILTTFRGTQIPYEELEKLKENEGKIISINGFLSTSHNIQVSLAFAGQSLSKAAFQAVLFEIEVDPSLTKAIFADIENMTRMKGEEEVLFTLNTLFKIGPVIFDSTLNIWKVKLTATDEGREKVEEHMVWLKQRLDEYSPVIYFGRLLVKELGQVDRGEKYFEMLLQSLPHNHANIADINNQIRNVHELRCDLNSALENFHLAYEIGQKQLPPNYPQLASSLGKIGRLYRSKRCFDQALDCYRKALDIGEKYYPGDNIHKAVMIQNIGIVHSDKGDFEIAIKYVYDALNIFKRILPPQHTYIARCLGYVGYVHETMNELDDALNCYHQLLTMDEECLSPDHLDRSTDLDMVANIYKRMGETEKALSFCKKKLSNQKNVLDENHPCIARTLMTMADALEKENPTESLEYYKQALSVWEQLTSPDHREMYECLTSISCLYSRNNMIDDALHFELLAYDLCRQKLPTVHMKIANSLRNIGIYHHCKGNTQEALRCLNESLLLYRTNYSSNHEDIERIEADIVEFRTLVITTVYDRRQPYIIPCTIVSHILNP